MRRRSFIALGGASVVWPLAANAQQPERRVGVLMTLVADDPVARTRVAAFVHELGRSGWADGRNLRTEIRWGANNPERVRAYVAELVALAPDVIFATGSVTVGPLLQATRTVPIVFVSVPDPVGAGYVESLARPGGNATGFTDFEYGIGAKWLELLKQIAPHLTRAGIVRDPTTSAGLGLFGAIQSVARSFAVEAIPINARDATEIERAVTAFARSPNGGLIVTGSALASVHRDPIASLAASHKLPAVYFQRLFPAVGGLVAYGPDFDNQYRQAAGYVDRILKGEKPADLPVQAPTRYELVVNLKTAAALGLTIPPSILARADEVIE